MKKIERCPFCGSEAALIKNYNTTHRKIAVFVQCRECRAKSGIRWADNERDDRTEAEALEDWNVRADR